MIHATYVQTVTWCVKGSVASRPRYADIFSDQFNDLFQSYWRIRVCAGEFNS